MFFFSIQSKIEKADEFKTFIQSMQLFLVNQIPNELQ